MPFLGIFRGAYKNLTKEELFGRGRYLFFLTQPNSCLSRFYWFIVENTVTLLNLSASPWQSVLDYVRSQCNDFGMAILDTVSYEGMEEGIVCLSVPDKFRETWLNSHYGSLLRKAFASVMGSAFIDYRVILRAVSAPVPEMKFTPAKPAVKRPAAPARPRKNRALGSPMYARYTFDNFVVGSCNSTAYKACLAAAENPGDKGMNPLLVFGASGLGKTHLLQAVAAKLVQDRPEFRVVYRQAYDFLRDTVSVFEAAKAKNWELRDKLAERFQQLYLKCDVLVIDDIQLLKKSVYCQEFLAKTINKMRNEGKLVLLSSDRKPASFKRLAEGARPSNDSDVAELTSALLNHLENCVAVGVDQPDLNTRMGVIRQKSERLPFASEDREEICRFLSVPPRANVRLIEGMLNWLDAMHSLNGVELSLYCVKQLLVSPQNDGATLTLRNISETVAASFNVDMVVLSSKRQDRGASIPRKVAMFLCRELTSETEIEVGKIFNRDYSTVIAAIRSLVSMMESDAALARRVQDLRYMLET